MSEPKKSRICIFRTVYFSNNAISWLLGVIPQTEMDLEILKGDFKFSSHCLETRNTKNHLKIHHLMFYENMKQLCQ